MYYKLHTPLGKACQQAYWDAEWSGLDPYYLGNNVFEIGTGHVEKVTSLISKYKLDILVESEYTPTGYKTDRRQYGLQRRF